jgi:uncharacterized protein (DUF433 family)
LRLPATSEEPSLLPDWPIGRQSTCLDRVSVAPTVYVSIFRRNPTGCACDQTADTINADRLKGAERDSDREHAVKWQERIVVDPRLLVGKPVIKGTRLAVEFLLELLAEGWTQEQILENYPQLTADDLLAALHYAAVP